MEIRPHLNTFWRCLILLLAITPARAVAASKVFILEKSEEGLLCGYTRESEWAQVPKDKDISFVAIVESENGTVSSILVQRFSEDTTTYDEYTIQKGVNVIKLKRTFDVVPDRVTREQIWAIQAGKAAKISERWMEFKTHRPIGPQNQIDDFGTIPIMLKMTDFPFYPLIVDQHPERWPSGRRCVPGSMDKLEGTQN